MLSRDDLHPYQERAVDFIVEKERCGLFLDLGLGKTVSTLTAVSDLIGSGIASKVLVIAPLRVANSVWAQESALWSHLKHLRVSVCTGSPRARAAALHRSADVFVINRENIVWLAEHYKSKWPFDTVVVDECFVGETEVLTPSGPRAIKYMRVGDIVVTSEGHKPITRVFKKETTRLVRVTLDDGTKIECTPEHPFATEVGWVQAVDVEGLRVLRSGFSNEQEDEQVLWQKLLDESKSENNAMWVQTMDAEGLRVVRSCFQNEGKDEQVLQQELLKKSNVGVKVEGSEGRNLSEDFKGASRENALEQGHPVVGRSEKEAERRPQGERPHAKGARWKRTYRPVRKTHDGDVVLGLDTSTPDPNGGSTGQRDISNMLQGRLRRPIKDDDHRSGRTVAHISAASGRKAGCFSGTSWVVNVEGVKCESPRTVYNLETDGVHDYFAGSTLVHNCSTFKNSQSKRFKALRKMLPYIERMVLLTGTPSPNGLIDLWAQMYLIDYGQALGRTLTNYRQRFFDPDFMGYRWTAKEGSEDKIHRLISDRVIHMSSEDYLDLPDRIDLVHKVQMPPNTEAAYRDFERTMLAELDDGEEVEATTAAVLANKMLQWANGAVITDDKGNWQETHKAKLDALQDIVDDNPNEPILVAYNYRSDLARIRAKFPEARVLDKDQSTIDDWNAGRIKMLVASPASAGHGLNLQRGGSICVWFGLNWSLELYQQFNARLHRQGQTKPVRIVHLVAEGTIDERVVSVLRDKGAVQGRLLDALKPH